jgi:hypothetical protein
VEIGNFLQDFTLLLQSSGARSRLYCGLTFSAIAFSVKLGDVLGNNVIDQNSPNIRCELPDFTPQKTV